MVAVTKNAVITIFIVVAKFIEIILFIKKANLEKESFIYFYFKTKRFFLDLF